jgi:hypothetical protein
MVSPDGYCGFWSVDLKQGFQLGPPAAGASGACHTVGPPYVLGGGICCKTEDNCYPRHKALQKRSIEPISISDTTDVDFAAASTAHITFYGDPAVYVEDGGVTTVLQLVADAHMEKLISFGEPVIKLCVDTPTTCQFYIGTAIGPSFSGATGECQEFNPSITLTSVQCIDIPLKQEHEFEADVHGEIDDTVSWR